MDHAFWHRRWQNQQIGFHRDAFHELLTSYFSKLGSSGRVFVPLCGKTKDMLWLLDQGYRVFGVEISELAVETFFRENQLLPKVTKRGAFKEYALDELVIWVGDVLDLTSEDLADIDAWYDRAALVALPDPLRARYVEVINQRLPSGSKGLLITVEYPSGLREGPPFSVAEEEVKERFGKRFKIRRMAQTQAFAKQDAIGASPITEQAYLLFD
ncbi:thiopurine S-methyltransferase [Pseudidiomarina insulisalsae]|uniref:Thiopurine S-methyltransferase n=1 Tax=Pseudidiomarina insulisalsae TaxID=575789 RepID=A0A432YR45_9GAMM|nr:thiopurine S-methyltransferase [Pseudidiomarina insulisalsae]RUO63752.1 thiopurine S-methyltransferase [Pseudidiomarina insulisalsae]